MKMDKATIADVASKLKFRTQAFINGKFVDAVSGRTFPT